MTNKNLADKDPENGGPPKKSDDYSTYKKHGMAYFTEQGVRQRTGLDDKKDWYLLCIRELLDNAADFLTKNYKGADDTIVITTVFKDDKFFRFKIRNSNYKDITVFQNKKAILDYDMTYGSKQYLYIISRGMLGDALKQILAFGYTLIHIHDDGSSFQDKQWEKPLIIRHNGKEFKIYLTVDMAKQAWDVRIEESKNITHTDTEIEFILPMVEIDDLDRATIDSNGFSFFVFDISSILIYTFVYMPLSDYSLYNNVLVSLSGFLILRSY